MSGVRFCYQTLEFEEIDIHVRTLKDNQQFFDADDRAKNLGISSASWPLFGLIWPSSRILADIMQNYKIEDKKILEVGCGIALSSLVLNERYANITATDYHPEVQSYLLKNTKLNNDRDIPFVRTSWQERENTLGKFDVIIGSDLLYEIDHATLLGDFIAYHASSTCEVIIVDPGRSNQAKFTQKMISLGFIHTKYKPEESKSNAKLAKSFVHYFNKVH